MKAIHIIAGLLALLAGAVALYATKGAPLHRRSGWVFAVAMATMTTTAAVIAQFFSPNRVNVVAAVLTFYLVATGVLAVRRTVPQMRALADGPSPAAVETNALVVEQDGAYIAFRVGAVLGQQDIVVRKLGAKLAALPGFTGSTILASGEPAIIISLAGLARRLQKPGEGRNREPSSNHSPKAAAGGQP